MTLSILPVELHLHVPDWRSALVLIVGFLACVDTAAAAKVSVMLVFAFVGVRIVEMAARYCPCSTSAIPERFV